MQETLEFLRKCGIYYLATVEDNKPQLRPFGTLNEFEGKLYILTGKSKNVAKQIEKNNNVQLAANLGENWIRVTTKLIEDDRVEAKKSMLDNNPHLRAGYDENDDNTLVLYMKDTHTTIYENGEEKTYNF